MNRKRLAAVGSIFAMLLISGCTAQIGYMTLQSAARQACLRQPPGAQAECESHLSKDDYDTYEKNRSAN